MQRLSLLYLLGLMLVVWGYAIGRFEIFPAAQIREIEAFAAGHDLGADTSVLEKMAHEAGLVPARFIREYPDVAEENTREMELPGARARRDAPQVYVDRDHRQGYRVVFGGFDFEDVFWGGVLIGSDGELLHTWRLPSEFVDYETEIGTVLSEVHLAEDGSIIYSLQEAGEGIFKVDACGDFVWSTEGTFHHTISPTEDGHFWSFAGAQYDHHHQLVKLSQDDGRIVQTIDMRDVMYRNEFAHIFDLQRHKPAEDSDASHGNDIDPLSRAMSAHFSRFDAGDLLISFRTHNLVFVLDPETLEIRWWRIGAWDRQHDPDWEADGTIAVFSNNERTPRKFSDIVAIDPETFDHTILVNGEQFDFYSSIMGAHELTPYGTRMISSSTQGWVFEVDDTGKIVFSFVNTYDIGDETALDVLTAHRLTDDYFSTEFWNRCPR